MGGEGGNGSEGDVVGSRGPRMASSIMYKETTNFVLCMKLHCKESAEREG